MTDLTFALRSLRRSPGWATVTVLTIALGVGASTAVFSVADRLLVRPLGYRDASRVYNVAIEGTIQGERHPMPMRLSSAREWQRSAHTIEAAIPYGPVFRAFLHGDLNDVRVTAARVDHGFLEFTGARPLIGRNFTPDETVPNGPRAIILSEGLWRRQFGGSPDVLGKVLRLAMYSDSDSRPLTIVGVMPASCVLPDFQLERPDVWLPLIDVKEPLVTAVAVRLTPGQSPQAASQELTAVLNRDGALDPTLQRLHARVRLTRPQDDLPFRQALLVLTGAVVLLLLIASSNVSHLLLQRGLTRERELAIRHALGAARTRLVRQLVTESALLGLGGGALAMLVGWAALNVVTLLRPTSLPALAYVSTTHGVVPLAAGLAIAVGLAVGVLGALHVAHGHLGQSLSSGTVASAPRGHRRLRTTLVIGQIALSTILLAGAILLIRVVTDLEGEQLGFEPRDMYAAQFEQLDLTPQATAAFAATVREAAARTLGSRDVTIAAEPVGGAMGFGLAAETPEHLGAAPPATEMRINYVASDYFSIMRMRLMAGRSFDKGPLALNEVIVSRSFALELWHDVNVVGRQFRNATLDGAIREWQTVIGVAPDVLTNRLDRRSKPLLYKAFPGNSIETCLLIRLHRQDAAQVLPRFAKSMLSDPLKWGVRDVNDEVEQSTAEPRFVMAVLSLFALCGVLLAGIGLFGVVSYTLSQRTREIGVRIALGATRGKIVSLFLRSALSEVALGTGIGLVGVLGATRVARTMVYGVHGFDAITFTLAAVSVIVASSVACAGPLFRATRVDPTVAIRS